MAKIFESFRFLRVVQREQFLLEVGRFYRRFRAILTTVQWCQVAQGNTRYVPRRYIHHILLHIGHWRSFGYNWWSPISGPCLRSVLEVDLRSLIRPCVHCDGLAMPAKNWPWRPLECKFCAIFCLVDDKKKCSQ